MPHAARSKIQRHQRPCGNQYIKQALVQETGCASFHLILHLSFWSRKRGDRNRREATTAVVLVSIAWQRGVIFAVAFHRTSIAPTATIPNSSLPRKRIPPQFAHSAHLKGSCRASTWRTTCLSETARDKTTKTTLLHLDSLFSRSTDRCC